MGSSLSTEYIAQRDASHVLVVGAGYGGIHCATALQKDSIPFTLVDPKAYFHHNITGLRTSVNPELAVQTAIDLKTTFGNSFLQGKVESIDIGNKKAIISIGQGGDEKTVSFTHLVMATGSTGPFPARCTTTPTKKDLLEKYEQVSREIEKASNIVVIGGGATGVEICGEIRDKYSEEEKKVTLLHSGSALLQYDFGEGMQISAKKQLEDFGVDVRLKVRVANLQDLKANEHLKQIIKTADGDEISCDLVFVCIGLHTNTSLANDAFGEDCLDSASKRVRVNECLQVINSTSVLDEGSIYAIGDACNTDQVKLAAHAEDHGYLVANNIKLSLNGQAPEKYKPRFTGIFVVIGKYRGVASLGGYNMPTCMVSLLKGRGLFIPRYWANMNQELPKI